MQGHGGGGLGVLRLLCAAGMRRRKRSFRREGCEAAYPPPKVPRSGRLRGVRSRPQGPARLQCVQWRKEPLDNRLPANARFNNRFHETRHLPNGKAVGKSTDKNDDRKRQPADRAAIALVGKLSMRLLSLSNPCKSVKSLDSSPCLPTSVSSASDATGLSVTSIRDNAPQGRRATAMRFAQTYLFDQTKKRRTLLTPCSG